MPEVVDGCKIKLFIIVSRDRILGGPLSQGTVIYRRETPPRADEAYRKSEGYGQGKLMEKV